MYCTSCGAKSRDDAKFCGSCGKQISRSESSTEDTPLASTSHTTVTQGNEKDKDKLLVVVAHIGACFFSFLAPLVVYVMRKDGDERERWAKDNAVSALNFQLTVLLLVVVILVLQAVIANRVSNWTLPMFLDGTMDSLARWSDILNIVLGSAILLDYLFCIVGAVKSTGGRVFSYPLSIKFIRTRKTSGDISPDSTAVYEKTGLTTATPLSSTHEALKEKLSNQGGETRLTRRISKKATVLLALLGILIIGAASLLSVDKDTASLLSVDKDRYGESKITESVIRSRTTRPDGTLGSMRGPLAVFHNRDSALAWVALDSKVIFSTESDWGLSASQIYSPDNRTGDYSHQFYRFSNTIGNSCEGPHFVVEITKKDITVHKIDTCDNWDHVANHLLFSDGKVLYKQTPKGER